MPGRVPLVLAQLLTRAQLLTPLQLLAPVQLPKINPRRGRLAAAAALVLWVCPLCVSTARSEDTLPKASRDVLVIAHRGASGYLPEHSEGAKVLAFAQGADVLEQDVVLSRDKVLIISHDITMDATTNVRERFADRAREDGRFYYADFDWSELRTLSLRPRQASRGSSKPKYSFHTDSRLMRLEDEIRMVRGLNEALNKRVGFHIELKAPSWHLKQFGFHMGDALVDLLDDLDVKPSEQLCFIQCFEPGELSYLRNERNCRHSLVQLMGGRPLGLVTRDPNQSKLETIMAELPEIAKYADGIGPAIPLLVDPKEGVARSTGVVEAAHRAGLVVHPFTVRTSRLPAWCESVDDLHRQLVVELNVDGLFTDFPDITRNAVDRYVSESAKRKD